MRAIIYAAGIGRRLGPATEHRPKILLEFGGRSLLRRHVERLAAAGVADIAIVTGFGHDLVAAEVGRVLEGAPAAAGGAGPVRIALRRNEAYLEGSAVSVFTAIDLMTEGAAPLLLMDGDVLYGDRMLPRLIQSESRTCLLIDRDCELDEVDPVLVPVRAGRPFDFRKGYKGPYELIGESIGFFKVGASDVPRIVEATRARSTGPRRAETLEDILLDLVREGRFGFEDVTGEPWIEIDFPEDLDRARDAILPRIE